VRRPRLAEVALALALAGILTADLYAVTTTNATTVVVDEAVRRFRATPEVATTAPPLPPSAPPATSAVPTTRRTSPSTSSTTTPRTVAVGDGSGPGPAPAQATAAGAVRPAAGVYRYATEGSESVSILGAQRRYPPETTRTVRLSAGCAWTFRIILLEEHQEEHTACSGPSTLDLTGSTNAVRWFGLDTLTRLACDTPIRHVDTAATPGSRMPFLCHEGGDSTFSGATTLVGQETVDVGGVARPAWRLSLTGTFEGKTRGTVTVSELIDRQTWITLFEQRTNDLKQQSLIGDIAYHQDLTLRLLGTSPTK